MSAKTCKVIYLLNEEGRKQSLLSGGDGKRMQELEAPISKELLELASVDDKGNVVIKIGFKNVGDSYYSILTEYKVKEYSIYEPSIEEVKEIIEFDKTQTVDELLLFEKNRIENIKKSREESEEKIKPLLEEYILEQKKKEEEKLQREEELRIKREQEQLEQEAKEKEEKLRKLKEKEEDENWIRNKGSKYLNQCLDLGYNCKRKYMEERVEKEFPQFEVDFDDNAGWRTRVSPSQEALDEVSYWIEKGFEARIVWLTASIHGDYHDYSTDFEPREAVTIKFKGYDLIKEM